jgi:hypothetical protein
MFPDIHFQPLLRLLEEMRIRGVDEPDLRLPHWSAAGSDEGEEKN